MKCDELQDALNSDSSDFKAIGKHLEVCPECNAKYSEDLEMEKALRELVFEPVTIDITENLRETLYLTSKNRLRFYCIRRWVWILSSAVAMILLLVGMPALTEWANNINQYFISTAPELKIPVQIDFENLPDLIESSKYYNYAVFSIFAILIGIFAYLWREFKSIVQ